VPKCSYFMESAGAMHVKIEENLQYVFQDVCHNVFLQLVIPREELERQRLKMLFFSPLMTTVEEEYLKNCIYREPINILEEMNDQIHQALAAVIPNMLRLARENLIKRARLLLQMKGGQFEHFILFILHVSYFIYCIPHRLSYKI
jgi:hypothetical protein